jgi:SAM-dependent methyltransferase
MTLINWYRRQREDFGTAAATKLLLRVSSRRAYVVFSNILLRATAECPCCGWRGRRFFDYIEMGYTVPNCACPQCDSHPRHREFFLWLTNHYKLEEKQGTALVFAPEQAIDPLWKSASKLRSYKVDVEDVRNVDVIADLTRLPFLAETADLLWCHHVLEQVPDYRMGLSELHRVLRSESGELIISVGSSNAGKTMEFDSPNKALSGNRRAFGVDFPNRLAEAGFRVERILLGLSDDEGSRYGINGEPFYRCTKLN